MSSGYRPMVSAFVLGVLGGCTPTDQLEGDDSPALGIWVDVGASP